jgi:hypothetical protein
MQTRASMPAWIALLAIGLPACHGVKSLGKPLFIGSPVISDLRAQTASAGALGAPAPGFKRLRFAIRVSATGKAIGESTETLKAASSGYGQYLEEVTYHLSGGTCTALNRTEAVGVGGFLTLLQAGQIWSSDCAGLGGGVTRREVTSIQIKSGPLFPLKVGNKLTLQYTVAGSDNEQDTGVAQYEETAEESYEVVERIPEFRLDSGRSLGEVFVVRVVAINSARKKRSYEFVFSTRLGWRVGYSTDVRYALVDWVP